jgi:hypothetical protein
MLELLRDPAWQSAGVLIGALVALWVYRAQRARRELSFGVLSTHSLLTVHSSFTNRVKVTLDDVPVSDAHLMVLALKNSGNVAIRPADFHKPLELRFSPTSRVLSVEVARKQPPNLEVELSLQGNSATLAPILLNPGEHIVLQALIAGKNPTVECDVRVEGISALKPVKRGSPPTSKDIYTRVGGVALGLPLRVAVFWFIVHVLDAALGAGMKAWLTVGDSLLVGLILVAVGMGVLEEIFDWLRSRFGRAESRSINDA